MVTIKIQSFQKNISSNVIRGYMKSHISSYVIQLA